MDDDDTVPEKVPEFERLRVIIKGFAKVNKVNPELSKIFTKTLNEDTVNDG